MPRGRVDAHRDPARVGGRLDRVDRRLDDRREVDGCISSRTRAADDARHVEQIVDELRLHARVAVDDVERLGLAGRVERAQLEHRHPAEDGVERRAQLVRDRRDELVLGAAQGLGRAPRRLLALEARPRAGARRRARSSCRERRRRGRGACRRRSGWGRRCRRSGFRGRHGQSAAPAMAASRLPPRAVMRASGLGFGRA